MDADMATYIWVPFNLEAMKLSAFYKKSNELVVLCPQFTPDRHQKFFYCKDYEDGIYPPNLLNTKNVSYTGLAFSHNKYNPLPMDIELCKPDTTLYSKMGKVMIGTRAQQRIHTNLTNAEHCRLSLDGKTIWSEYPRQFSQLKSARRVILHDYDLGAIEGSFQEVQRIVRNARQDGWATKIGMKFPVQVSDGQNLLQWSSLNSDGVFYSLRYNGVIDDDAFIEWVGYCRNKNIFSQIEYNVTPPWYDENYFLTALLPKIFHQVIISRSYYIFFSLTYSEEFFTDKRWVAVLQLFNYYMNSYNNHALPEYLKKITDDTLFDFVSKTSNQPKAYYGNVFTQNQMREIFAFVREANYPLFKEFYECNARTLGGKL